MGNTYRNAMERLRGGPFSQITCLLLLKIIQVYYHIKRGALMAFGDFRIWKQFPVTTDELLEIYNRVGDNKAPDLAGIPNKALKLVVTSTLNEFDHCLRGACPRRHLLPQ